MFQNFTETADPTKGAERARLLRTKLKEIGLDGFIVPRADEHQGEYVPKSAARLAWLTGFTGSAGTAVVLADKAAIFVDGRYTLQVREQVDPSAFEPDRGDGNPVADWLKANVSTRAEDRLRPVADDAHAGESVAKALETAERSSFPSSKIPSMRSGATGPSRRWPPCRAPDELAGRPAAEKIAEIAKNIAEKRADVAVLTDDPPAVAWLFNIRGGDLAHTPFPLSFAAGSRIRPAGALHRRTKTVERSPRPAGDICRIARNRGIFPRG